MSVCHCKAESDVVVFFPCLVIKVSDIMPKALRSDARNIILKVLAFMEEEKRLQAPIIPFQKLYDRVAAATG